MKFDKIVLILTILVLVGSIIVGYANNYVQKRGAVKNAENLVSPTPAP